jgi:hypothetical protein
MITDKTFVVASSNQSSSELDPDTTVVLGHASGMYHGLNRIGTRIWRLVQDPTSVDEICDQLLSQYDVEPARCRRDVTELLEALLEHGLLEVRSDREI